MSRSPATVVVTGLGAIIGQGIAKSLRALERPVRIIGVDRNPNSVAPYWCDTFVPKPACEEESGAYLDFWVDLLRRESVDIVMPGLEIDVSYLNDHRDALAPLAALALNRAQLITLALDKLAFGLELQRLNLPAIPTIESRDWQTCVSAVGPAPLILKPRFGNGSRGIVRVNNEDDFNYWLRRSDGPLLVQRVIGRDEEEYTAGGFGFGDGTSLPAIVFRRRLSAVGNTQYAEVVESADLHAVMERLVEAFKPLGPTNYQFRVEDGVPYLLEINPRFSSSNSLRTAFGYNEAAMALDFYLEQRRPEMPVITYGKAWRYFEDFIVR